MASSYYKMINIVGEPCSVCKKGKARVVYWKERDRYFFGCDFSTEKDPCKGPKCWQRMQVPPELCNVVEEEDVKKINQHESELVDHENEDCDSESDSCIVRLKSTSTITRKKKGKEISSVCETEHSVHKKKRKKIKK